MPSHPHTPPTHPTTTSLIEARQSIAGMNATLDAARQMLRAAAQSLTGARR